MLAPYLYVVFMGSERSVIITGAMSLLISFRKILTQFLTHRALFSLPKRACVLVTIILKEGRLYAVLQCVLAIVKYNFFTLFSFSISSYLCFLFFFNVLSFRFYLASLAPLQLSPEVLLSSQSYDICCRMYQAF